MTGRRPARIFKILLAAVLLFAGCAGIKQCAYQGLNGDQWQQPQKVVDSLQIRAGAVVADLGAGGGYFTFRLADAVGQGGEVAVLERGGTHLGLEHPRVIDRQRHQSVA